MADRLNYEEDWREIVDFHGGLVPAGTGFVLTPMSGGGEKNVI